MLIFNKVFTNRLSTIGDFVTPWKSSLLACRCPIYLVEYLDKRNLEVNYFL